MIKNDLESQISLLKGAIFFLILAFSIVFYFFYRAYKNKKLVNEYQEQLKEIMKKYIRPGVISSLEFARLFTLMCQMDNKMGIYRESVFKAISDFGENGGIDLNLSSWNDSKLKQKQEESEIIITG
ncbi:hypothetical protein ['Camptotheca acuminata' phytoplasma]|uniref:hypothetical protein n=1 Tax='Camptotheca acuminata' phytoplasma TaxID=3239192 RepID=UPI00351A7591